MESVAIIGGGASGIITLDALVREKKFSNIRLFERRKELGGCWIFDESPPEALPSIESLSQRTADETEKIEGDLPRYVPKSTKQRFIDTPVYSYLESNIEAETMQFSEEPFPEIRSKESTLKYGQDTPFRHNNVIKGYLQGLSRKKVYDEYIELKSSVELVEKNQDTGKWTLTIRKFGHQLDYLYFETFDAVVIASGHYDVPYIPNIPGLQEFHDNSSKLAIHTKGYRSKEPFRDKKVIVVGASVSAMDAVRDILPVSKLPIISSQKPTSKPHPYFGDSAFNHEDVSRRGEILRIDNDTNTVYFNDGSTVTDVDSIIFGTGYSFSYPFLKNIDLTGNRVQGLYQQIFRIGDESLSFVGAIAAGLTFKAFEWQAVLVARVYASRAQLPSIEEQIKWEKDRIKARGNGAKFTALYPDFEQYFEKIRELAGDDGPGRKLPPFNKVWEERFFAGHNRRIKYWLDNNTSSKDKDLLQNSPQQQTVARS